MRFLQAFALRRSLFAALCCVLLAGCPPGGGDNNQSDAGADTGVPLLEVTLGQRAGDAFVEFGSEESLEIVAGFQGGYHVEPALRLEPPDADSFITVVDYTVTDLDTGEVLNEEPGGYRIDGRGWQERPEGLVRLFERVILDVVDADDAAGRRVRIDVEVTVEGGLGSGSDSIEVDLVDDFDERMGLHGP